MRFSSAFIWTVFVREVILAASFLTSIVLARTLGPEGLGTYSLVVTIATLLSQGVNLGFNGSNHLLVARDPANAGRLLTQTFLPLLLLGVPLAIGTCLAPGAFDFIFGDLAFRWRVVALVGMALLVINQNLNSLFFGLQWYRRNGIGIVLSPLGIALSSLGLVAAGLLTLERALMLWLAWNTVSALLFAALLVREHPPRGFSLGLLKEAIPIGIRILSVSVLGVLAYRSMLILVNRDLGRSAVGFYSLALSIAALLEHAPQALGSLIINRVFSKQSSPEEVARILRLHWILGGVLVLLLELAGPTLLTLVFGQRYAEAVPALRILALGYYFNGGWSLAAGYLTGRYACPPSVVGLSALTLVVSVGLALVLIPRHGLQGAAAAWSIAGATSAVALIAVFRRDGGAALRLLDLFPGPADVSWMLSRIRASRMPAK